MVLKPEKICFFVVFRPVLRQRFRCFFGESVLLLLEYIMMYGLTVLGLKGLSFMRTLFRDGTGRSEEFFIKFLIFLKKALYKLEFMV